MSLEQHVQKIFSLGPKNVDAEINVALSKDKSNLPLQLSNYVSCRLDLEANKLERLTSEECTQNVYSINDDLPGSNANDSSGYPDSTQFSQSSGASKIQELAANSEYQESTTESVEYNDCAPRKSNHWKIMPVQVCTTCTNDPNSQFLNVMKSAYLVLDKKKILSSCPELINETIKCACPNFPKSSCLTGPKNHLSSKTARDTEPECKCLCNHRCIGSRKKITPKHALVPRFCINNFKKRKWKGCSIKKHKHMDNLMFHACKLIPKQVKGDKSAGYIKIKGIKLSLKGIPPDIICLKKNCNCTCGKLHPKDFDIQELPHGILLCTKIKPEKDKKSKPAVISSRKVCPKSSDSKHKASDLKHELYDIKRRHSGVPIISVSDHKIKRRSRTPFSAAEPQKRGTPSSSADHLIEADYFRRGSRIIKRHKCYFGDLNSTRRHVAKKTKVKKKRPKHFCCENCWPEGKPKKLHKAETSKEKTDDNDEVIKPLSDVELDRLVKEITGEMKQRRISKEDTFSQYSEKKKFDNIKMKKSNESEKKVESETPTKTRRSKEKYTDVDRSLKLKPEGLQDLRKLEGITPSRLFSEVSKCVACKGQIDAPYEIKLPPYEFKFHKIKTKKDEVKSHEKSNEKKIHETYDDHHHKRKLEPEEDSCCCDNYSLNDTKEEIRGVTICDGDKKLLKKEKREESDKKKSKKGKEIKNLCISSYIQPRITIKERKKPKDKEMDAAAAWEWLEQKWEEKEKERKEREDREWQERVVQLEREIAEREREERKRRDRLKIKKEREREEAERKKAESENAERAKSDRKKTEREKTEREKAEREKEQKSKEKALKEVKKRERECLKKLEIAEKEQLERERKEKEKLAKEKRKLEKEKAENERKAKEQMEREKEAKERQIKEAVEKERAVAKRLAEEKERMEKEREAKEREREEKERAERKTRDEERMEKEKAEKEKMDKAKVEKERLMKIKLERKKLEMEKQEFQKEKERIEKEKILQEKKRLEKEKQERDKADKERREREKAEIEKEFKEKERVWSEKEKAEKEKEREQLEREKTKIDKERERLEKEKTKRVIIQKEKAAREKERERLEKERQEKEKERLERENEKEKVRIEMERVKEREVGKAMQKVKDKERECLEKEKFKEKENEIVKEKERERIEREKERERLEREKERLRLELEKERERIEREKEKQRLEREKQWEWLEREKERQRIEQEKERERLEREKERTRIERENERQRLEQEKERERIEREKEKQRLEQEIGKEKERLEKEKAEKERQRAQQVKVAAEKRRQERERMRKAQEKAERGRLEKEAKQSEKEREIRENKEKEDIYRRMKEEQEMKDKQERERKEKEDRERKEKEEREKREAAEKANREKMKREWQAIERARLDKEREKENLEREKEHIKLEKERLEKEKEQLRKEKEEMMKQKAQHEQERLERERELQEKERKQSEECSVPERISQGTEGASEKMSHTLDFKPKLICLPPISVSVKSSKEKIQLISNTIPDTKSIGVSSLDTGKSTASSARLSIHGDKTGLKSDPRGCCDSLSKAQSAKTYVKNRGGWNASDTDDPLAKRITDSTVQVNVDSGSNAGITSTNQSRYEERRSIRLSIGDYATDSKRAETAGNESKEFDPNKNNVMGLPRKLDTDLDRNSNKLSQKELAKRQAIKDRGKWQFKVKSREGVATRVKYDDSDLVLGAVFSDAKIVESSAEDDAGAGDSSDANGNIDSRVVGDIEGARRRSSLDSKMMGAVRHHCTKCLKAARDELESSRPVKSVLSACDKDVGGDIPSAKKFYSKNNLTDLPLPPSKKEEIKLVSKRRCLCKPGVGKSFISDSRLGQTRSSIDKQVRPDARGDIMKGKIGDTGEKTSKLTISDKIVEEKLSTSKLANAGDVTCGHSSAKVGTKPICSSTMSLKGQLIAIKSSDIFEVTPSKLAADSTSSTRPHSRLPATRRSSLVSRGAKQREIIEENAPPLIRRIVRSIGTGVDGITDVGTVDVIVSSGGRINPMVATGVNTGSSICSDRSDETPLVIITDECSIYTEPTLDMSITSQDMAALCQHLEQSVDISRMTALRGAVAMLPRRLLQLLYRIRGYCAEHHRWSLLVLILILLAGGGTFYSCNSSTTPY